MGEKKKPRVSKLNVWMKHFLNESCSTTFLNRTESAKRARYKCNGKNSFENVGHQNYRKCRDKIEKWLDEHGLSENALKIKMLSLLEAKETKFFSAPIKDETGNTTDILVKNIEVEAIETQRKTLDMAMKMRGMFAPTKHELTGRNGGPVEILKMDLAGLQQAIQKSKDD
jgi:hypothetical protein